MGSQPKKHPTLPPVPDKVRCCICGNEFDWKRDRGDFNHMNEYACKVCYHQGGKMI